MLHGGGSPAGDLKVKSTGVWAGGGGRREGENVLEGRETIFNCFLLPNVFPVLLCIPLATAVFLPR